MLQWQWQSIQLSSLKNSLQKKAPSLLCFLVVPSSILSENRHKSLCKSSPTTPGFYSVIVIVDMSDRIHGVLVLFITTTLFLSSFNMTLAARQLVHMPGLPTIPYLPIPNVNVSEFKEEGKGKGKSRVQVRRVETEEQVAMALAKYTAHLSERFIAEKGSFSVVLSGGSLIDTMRYLTKGPYKETVEWSKWSVFWVDERVVPLSSDDSNYKLAYNGFFSKVSIPAEAIYAINDKLEPDSAAEDYEQRIKDLVHKGILPLSQVHSHHGFPQFDLMLLGMGPDGHVASLFPNRTQQFEMKRWVTYITDSPKPPPPRITFTFPVINAATEIAMVVTGAELAHAVKEVLGTENSDLPAAKVRAHDELTWFLDKDASALLLH